MSTRYKEAWGESARWEAMLNGTSEQIHAALLAEGFTEEQIAAIHAETQEKENVIRKRLRRKK